MKVMFYDALIGSKSLISRIIRPFCWLAMFFNQHGDDEADCIKEPSLLPRKRRGTRLGSVSQTQN